MKTILCFGDSNTHGTSPRDWSRFDANTRWPGVMRSELGKLSADGYAVIEEGCGGRTTIWEDPIESPGSGSKNGSAYLRPCLHSHAPIDLVIILLGTNDLKHRFCAGADDIARGAGVLVDICQKSAAGLNNQPPKVLLIAPPPVGPLKGTPFEEMIAGGEEKSRLFGKWFRQVASEKGCDFLDAGQIIISSPTEGVHWEASEHVKLGKAVALKVRELMG